MTNVQFKVSKTSDLDQVVEYILKLSPKIIALEGPLGAGKTTLTKDLAKQLGVTETITSPTYVLETEHRILDTEHYFIHIDCYRMESFDELLRLGIEKRIKHEDIIVIEWADKFRSQILDLRCQKKMIWVRIGLGKKENERVVEIS